MHRGFPNRESQACANSPFDGNRMPKKNEVNSAALNRLRAESQHATATIDDVAAACGVSTATVSRVLNRTGSVSADTTAMVKEMARQLGYKPHKQAQALARRSALARQLRALRIGDRLPPVKFK